MDPTPTDEEIGRSLCTFLGYVNPYDIQFGVHPLRALGPRLGTHMDLIREHLRVSQSRVLQFALLELVAVAGPRSLEALPEIITLSAHRFDAGLRGAASTCLEAIVGAVRGSPERLALIDVERGRVFTRVVHAHGRLDLLHAHVSEELDVSIGPSSIHLVVAISLVRRGPEIDIDILQ